MTGSVLSIPEVSGVMPPRILRTFRARVRNWPHGKHLKAANPVLPLVPQRRSGLRHASNYFSQPMLSARRQPSPCRSAPPTQAAAAGHNRHHQASRPDLAPPTSRPTHGARAGRCCCSQFILWRPQAYSRCSFFSQRCSSSLLWRSRSIFTRSPLRRVPWLPEVKGRHPRRQP